MTSGGNGRRGLLLLVRRAVFVQPLDQSGPGQAHAEFRVALGVTFDADCRC